MEYFNGDTTYYVIKADSEDEANSEHRKLYGEDPYYYNMNSIDIRELTKDLEEICTQES